MVIEFDAHTSKGLTLVLAKMSLDIARFAKVSTYISARRRGVHAIARTDWHGFEGVGF